MVTSAASHRHWALRLAAVAELAAAKKGIQQRAAEMYPPQSGAVSAIGTVQRDADQWTNTAELPADSYDRCSIQDTEWTMVPE
jgi:hypothetical protein